MVTTILKTLKKHVRNCLTIQNNWRLSGNFWHNQEFFWIIKTLRTIRKISRLSEIFQDYLETFQVIQKLSGPSGKYLDYPETFQTIRKLSWTSGNFPDGLETSQCNFKGYAQKLSGRAKTFWMAMPPCHDGFCASAQVFDKITIIHICLKPFYTSMQFITLVCPACLCSSCFWPR